MSSPTQRSLKMLRDEGWTVQVVERWNPHARIRQDLFGFIDLLALKENMVLAVQTTSTGNMQARIKKIEDTPAAKLWLASPSRTLHVHGWSKKGPRGKRKTWQCKTVNIWAPAPF